MTKHDKEVREEFAQEIVDMIVNIATKSIETGGEASKDDPPHSNKELLSVAYEIAIRYGVEVKL